MTLSTSAGGNTRALWCMWVGGVDCPNPRETIVTLLRVQAVCALGFMFLIIATSINIVKAHKNRQQQLHNSLPSTLV